MKRAAGILLIIGSLIDAIRFLIDLATMSVYWDTYSITRPLFTAGILLLGFVLVKESNEVQ